MVDQKRPVVAVQTPPSVLGGVVRDVGAVQSYRRAGVPTHAAAVDRVVVEEYARGGVQGTPGAFEKNGPTVGLSTPTGQLQIWRSPDAT